MEEGIFGSCPLCGKELLGRQASIQYASADFYSCPQCGKYSLAIEATTKDELKTKLHLLAGYLFEIKNAESGTHYVLPTEQKFKEFISDSSIPQRISEKPTKLLKFINSHTTELGECIPILPAAAYAKNCTEALEIISMLTDEGYLKDVSTDRNLCVSITYRGMKYLESVELQHITNQDQAFIAMWFDESQQIVKDVWNKIIKPGCEDAGYRPVRVLEREYNDSVVDEIIALIKESAFAIVDFSGNRGGVYYEAGYAKGLGKEVISLCHKSWFDNPRIENHTVHFDLNHNNFIVWRTGEEGKARIQLTNRIRATIGIGKFNSKK